MRARTRGSAGHHDHPPLTLRPEISDGPGEGAGPSCRRLAVAALLPSSFRGPSASRRRARPSSSGWSAGSKFKKGQTQWPPALVGHKLVEGDDIRAFASGLGRAGAARRQHAAGRREQPHRVTKLELRCSKISRASRCSTGGGKVRAIVTQAAVAARSGPASPTSRSPRRPAVAAVARDPVRGHLRRSTEGDPHGRPGGRRRQGRRSEGGKLATRRTRAMARGRVAGSRRLLIAVAILLLVGVAAPGSLGAAAGPAPRWSRP